MDLYCIRSWWVGDIQVRPRQITTQPTIYRVTELFWTFNLVFAAATDIQHVAGWRFKILTCRHFKLSPSHEHDLDPCLILCSQHALLYNYFIRFGATVKIIAPLVLWMTWCTIVRGLPATSSDSASGRPQHHGGIVLTCPKKVCDSCFITQPMKHLPNPQTFGDFQLRPGLTSSKYQSKFKT